ncbi:hypothetical protein [Streptantibioticus silvisoli]|uniref:Uncharacterized protein n=1 Tax=Streptantibioticus silvisoli TaxID=2705255 RepID=A0ABT6W5Q6_9ACTN|nr:hypothetical protein [Streptantibioticus silvisoli]MDI5964851.1 hypothetical protein [Streptantibioticus silvisoli]
MNQLLMRPTTRRQETRTAARILRDRANTTRATRRAVRAVATGTPQAASTHLTAAGLSPTDAHRFSGAFSRSVTPTTTGTGVIKLKGRVTKTVPVKLYDTAAFNARLAVYRPKDTAAASRFAQAAHRLAA